MGNKAFKATYKSKTSFTYVQLNFYDTLVVFILTIPGFVTKLMLQYQAILIFNIYMNNSNGIEPKLALKPLFLCTESGNSP